MAPYKTLVVAPKTDLIMVEDEVQQVVNILGAKWSGTHVTIKDMLTMLAEPFDIIWFATHGDHDGVYLSDGILSTSEMTALVRSNGTSLVVLNTCESRGVALSIYDELRIELVCTVKKIPDRTAFITGTIFARQIANGLSFREAYEQAKPGQNTTYLFLPEKEPYMPPPQPDSRAIHPAQDFEQLAEQLRQLEITVVGHTNYGVPGLRKQVEELTGKVDGILKELAVIKTNQTFNRRVLIYLCVISFALLIAVSIQIFQGQAL